MKYSERLGEISDQQIQLAINKHMLGKLIKTVRITSGLFGQNLFFQTDKGNFVLRGKPHFDWQFPTEKFFADELSKINIPTPVPYIVDNDTSIFGWPYVIMPKLEGVNLSSKLNEEYFTDSDRFEIAKAQGQFLFKIQELKFSKIGKYNHIKNVIENFELSIHDFIYSRIMERLVKAEENIEKRKNSKNIEWFENIYNTYKNSLDDFKPTVVLQDYKFENTLVKKNLDHWEICALFDLMECYVGHPETDLSRTFCKYIDNSRPDLAITFINSWKELSKPDIKFKNRFPLFILLDRSIIWEWRQRSLETRDGNFKSYVEKYLVRWGA